MVNRCHQQVHSSRLKRATEMGVVSLCPSCRDASTDMQHDLFRSTCDLDLMSNIEPGLSRLPCICFDAPCREEHDGARIMPLELLVRKLFVNFSLPKTAIFAVF